MLGACPKQEEIWVAEHSRADSVVFGIGTSRGGDPPRRFGGLRVDHCGSDAIGPDALWLLVAAGRERTVSRVMYGRAPEGYRSDAGPSDLPPGCYMVSSIGANGRTEFEITASGSVIERERP